jgi:hypothetical protein
MIWIFNGTYISPQFMFSFYLGFEKKNESTGEGEGTLVSARSDGFHVYAHPFSLSLLNGPAR